MKENTHGKHKICAACRRFCLTAGRFSTYTWKFFGSGAQMEKSNKKRPKTWRARAEGDAHHSIIPVQRNCLFQTKKANSHCGLSLSASTRHCSSICINFLPSSTYCPRENLLCSGSNSVSGINCLLRHLPSPHLGIFK